MDDLDWEPKNNFNDALRKTIKWYIENLKWCKKIMNKSNYKGQRLGL